MAKIINSRITPWKSVPFTATNTPNATGFTLAGSTTAPTFGTGGVQNAWWRRVGDSMEIRVESTQTVAGTAGSGNYYLVLPTTYVIDITVKIGSGAHYVRCGHSTYSLGGSSVLEGKAAPLDSAKCMFTIDNSVTADGVWDSTSAYNLSVANARFSHWITVPIVGWS